jgi:hypothetical protein
MEELAPFFPSRSALLVQSVGGSLPLLLGK